MHMTQEGSIAQSLQKLKQIRLKSVSSGADNLPRQLLYKICSIHQTSLLQCTTHKYSVNTRSVLGVDIDSLLLAAY